LQLEIGLNSVSMRNELSHTNESLTKRIEMYFGSPTSSELLENWGRRANERNLSLEYILLEEFEFVCDLMQNRTPLPYEGKDYSVNLFDSHCAIHADTDGVFFSPPVEFGKHSYDGGTYPKLILQDGYLRNKDNIKEFPLTDIIVNVLGEEYQKFFNFEFIGFERL
jgi:hypothetical protein